MHVQLRSNGSIPKEISSNIRRLTTPLISRSTSCGWIVTPKGISELANFYLQEKQPHLHVDNVDDIFHEKNTWEKPNIPFTWVGSG